MLNQYDAVIFDLDGTLIDSMWLWHAIDIEYLDRFGLKPPKDRPCPESRKREAYLPASFWQRLETDEHHGGWYQ